MPSPDIFSSPLYGGGKYLITARRRIPYLMLHRSGQGYRETWQPSLVNQHFVALVRWDQANDWIVDMLGEHRLSNGKIRRNGPQVHPFFPGSFCVGLELQEGIGELGMDPDVVGALHYEYAVYTCSFSPLTYDVGSDDNADRNGEISRYVTRDRKLVGESIQVTGQLVFPNQSVSTVVAPASDGQTLPQSVINVGSTTGFPLSGSIVIATTTGNATVSYTGLTATSFTGCSGGTGTLKAGGSVASATNSGYTPFGTNPVIQTAYQQIKLIHEYVPADALPALLAKATQYINTVNVVPFDVSAGSYTVGTVLYVGLSGIERIPMSPAGNSLVRLTHDFIFRPQGWNTALRLNSQGPPGQWAPIKALSIDGRTTWDPYLVAFDHSQLFNPS